LKVNSGYYLIALNIIAMLQPQAIILYLCVFSIIFSIS